MIDGESRFVKLDKNDIEVGKPLPHTLYDGNRNLLLKRGHVIESGHQRETLMAVGLYRKLNERQVLPVDPVPIAEDVPTSRETNTTLDASHIRIGDSLQMQSTAEAPRLLVKVIGYLKNRGLIVTVPEANGEFVMLKDGLSFIVRFFSGQHAYAFTCTVVKQTSMPFPHVHLSYPREVRGLEIRKNSRVDVELIAAIESEGEGAVALGAGKIVNLSTGGGGLRTKTKVGKKGDTISVKFKLQIHDIQSYTVFESIIRTVTEDNSDLKMPYLYGLQFVNPDPTMTLAVAAFVYQKMVGDAH